MTEELVEKVAKAIHDGYREFEAKGENPNRCAFATKPWEQLQPHSQERYRSSARAAISAYVLESQADGFGPMFPTVVQCDEADANPVEIAPGVEKYTVDGVTYYRGHIGSDVLLTAFSAEEKEAFREQLPVPEADGTVDRLYSDLGGCD